MRALPYAYRNMDAQPGTLLQFAIRGECGGTWRLTGQAADKPSSVTTIPQEIAWRVFTKGIDRTAAAAQIRVAGNGELGLHILSMTAMCG